MGDGGARVAGMCGCGLVRARISYGEWGASLGSRAYARVVVFAAVGSVRAAEIHLV